MTASTHGTFRTMTRPVVMAGIVTVGATALTLPFATTATADDTTQAGITTATADHTTAPAAYTPHGPDGLLGKPTTSDDADDNGDNGDADHADDGDNADAEEGGKPAEKTQPEDENQAAEDGKPAEGVIDGHADGFDADTGRGEKYHQDGSLVVIPQNEQPKPEPASSEQIDGWIKEALKIMEKEGIPGTYESIHRNLMRESAGDPLTINLWDTNAEQDIPSKGLLQVIDPTFEQYHVDGTSENIYDPVANITAACNYAADRYGSMENVDSAY
ncbi:transglycosylase SLT domain-containing protein [Streptomyces sp. 3MP-14]|uniref:Transglycosylase SLT domain-containing protein n=1 Tax=Streptomyces mimosae TaxID=2586635 RepID=A0A5N6ALM6_9ACTN|nr:MULTISPECIES: transglycosylase SLT domain-containing protein [Streptomyces]KAB8169737.1 transglycosylase SLT domain-containing protein [Streptomyces mimosae]KAB8178485.1 transglycosylase SLT domain-containing protein [Streptomyces sp. 3MP-14]